MYLYVNFHCATLSVLEPTLYLCCHWTLLCSAEMPPVSEVLSALTMNFSLHITEHQSALVLVDPFGLRLLASADTLAHMPFLCAKVCVVCPATTCRSSHQHDITAHLHGIVQGSYQMKQPTVAMFGTGN